MKPTQLGWVALLLLVSACQSGGPPAPSIASFTAAPSSLPLGGGNVTLSWEVSNASSLSIDQGLGAVTGTTKGVALTTTTTYTLTATNSAGAAATKSVTVTVAGPPNQALYALTDTGQVLTLNSSDPSQALNTVNITGVNPGDALRAIDVRPQNGLLYALGVNPTTDTAQLYLLNPISGAVSPVGTAGGFVDGLGSPVDLPDGDYDLEFNPAADRARVIGGSLSFRMNPNTGTAIDGDLNGAAGSVAGLNPDGAINGATTSVQAAAYTNNNPNNGNITTLYTLGVAEASLFIQNPPNAGTQTLPRTLSVGGNLIAISGQAGLDIAPGVNTNSSGTGVTSGLAYASFTRGGLAGVYAIDLTNGNTILSGSFGSLPAIRDIAVAVPTTNTNAIGLAAAGGSLVRFAVATPGTTTSVSLSGVGVGEALVAISGRPATGQLYGLGVNDAANTATLYLLDPQTGVATVVGASSQIAFADAAGNVIDLPAAGAGYGMDFNPTLDRIRVVTGTGLNFRVNPILGTPVDGNLNNNLTPPPGTNPDGFISGLPGGSTGVTATSYSNNQVGASTTTQYAIDPTSRQLFIQNPPNAGTLTGGQAITLSGSSLAFTSVNGFDIPMNLSVTGLPASTDGYVVLTVGGNQGLYRLNLNSGVLTSVGAVPVALRSLVVSP